MRRRFLPNALFSIPVDLRALFCSRICARFSYRRVLHGGGAVIPKGYGTIPEVGFASPERLVKILV